jgi:hypothetical protein
MPVHNPAWAPRRVKSITEDKERLFNANQGKHGDSVLQQRTVYRGYAANGT